MTKSVICCNLIFQQISRSQEGQYYIGLTVDLDKTFR